MRSTLRASSRCVASAMLIGALAGTALVAVIGLGTSHNRPMLVYLVYGMLVVCTGILLRHAGSRIRRFALGLAVFMLATLVVYIYVVAFVSPSALKMPLWEHVWRLGFMLGLGTLATAIPLACGALIGTFRGGPDASSRQRGKHQPRRGGSDAPARGSRMEPATTLVGLNPVRAMAFGVDASSLTRLGDGLFGPFPGLANRC
jgi:hypothetical protein